MTDTMVKATTQALLRAGWVVAPHSPQGELWLQLGAVPVREGTQPLLRLVLIPATGQATLYQLQQGVAVSHTSWSTLTPDNYQLVTGYVEATAAGVGL